ncbi:MAG TPA: PilN domain-containing protein [Candidatus Gastranaerophilales bacterium]|nr:PilN domain-containing protein [Candidatus Gastranaerophilales bacterium]
MEFIKNFAKKFSTISPERIGIYISADSKMEAVYYNSDSREIFQCKKIDFQYNHVLREINLTDFETSLLALIKSIEAPPSTPICICLPNILTSLKSFPSDLEDAEIEVALASESEKSYIFKKTEPKPSWVLIDENEQTLNNLYLYSIIQKNQAEKIDEICAKNNLTLLAIDVSFTSLLRGLETAGLINQNIDENLKWCLITISVNNYLIAKFEGPKLLNILESPLALRSIEPDVLYQTLNNTIFEKLQYEKLSNLYIVSQTQDFVAAKLAEYLKLMCNIHTIDRNKFNKNPLFVSKMPSVDTISLESVGAASWNLSKINLNFNFSSLDTKNEFQGILGKIGIKKTLHLYLFSGIILTLFLLISLNLILFGLNNYFIFQIASKVSKIDELKKLNVTSAKKFDLNETMSFIYSKNSDFLSSYDALGAVIPEKLWLESFLVNDDLNIQLKGKSYNIEDIFTYYENLKNMAKFNNLKIKSIETISSGGSSKSPATSPDQTIQMNLAAGSSDISLPPPPIPGSETSPASGINSFDNVLIPKKNYYQFTFSNYEVAGKEDPGIKNLPDFVKNIIVGK